MTAVLSNLVSNVPAVLMMKPFVGSKPGIIAHHLVDHRYGLHPGGQFHHSWFHRQPDRGAEARHARGQDKLLELFRVGAPLTIITLVLGTLWLWL